MWWVAFWDPSTWLGSNLYSKIPTCKITCLVLNFSWSHCSILVVGMFSSIVYMFLDLFCLLSPNCLFVWLLIFCLFFQDFKETHVTLPPCYFLHLNHLWGALNWPKVKRLQCLKMDLNLGLPTPDLAPWTSILPGLSGKCMRMKIINKQISFLLLILLLPKAGFRRKETRKLSEVLGLEAPSSGQHL